MMVYLKYALLVAPFVMANNAFSQGVTGANADIDISQQVIGMYCTVHNIMTGHIGVLIGLFVALYGFYKFIMSGSLKGIIIVIVGALIPAFPSVFAGTTEFLAAAFPTSGGTSVVRELNEQCPNFSLPEPTTNNGGENGGNQNDSNYETLEKLTNTAQGEGFENYFYYYPMLDVRSPTR